MDGKRCETFIIRFASGVAAVYSSFHGAWAPFDIVIMTTKDTYSFRIDSSKIYGALLDSMPNVKNEVATINNIYKTDFKALLLGFTTDPAADVAKLQAKLKTAGAEKVYAEMQKQAV